MPPITSDYHIHTHRSCDSAALRLEDLLVEAPAAGIREFGVTDHIHTPFNLPDLEASRADFEALSPPPNVRFGVEVSCVSEWELERLSEGQVENATYGIRQGGPVGAAPAIGIGPEDLRRLGVEFVVGGTHWPLYVPLEAEAVTRDYHRQNMFLATHPLVDVVAHPWWWMGAWKDEDGVYRTDPWLDDFGRIPQSMHEEFIAALLEHGKAAEINLDAMLLTRGYTDEFKRQYLDYLALLQSRGVTMSMGSDCHAEHYRIGYEEAAALLERHGIRTEGLWRPLA